MLEYNPEESRRTIIFEKYLAIRSCRRRRLWNFGQDQAVTPLYHQVALANEEIDFVAQIFQLSIFFKHHWQMKPWVVRGVSGWFGLTRKS